MGHDVFVVHVASQARSRSRRARRRAVRRRRDRRAARRRSDAGAGDGLRARRGRRTPRSSSASADATTSATCAPMPRRRSRTSSCKTFRRDGSSHELRRDGGVAGVAAARGGRRRGRVAVLHQGAAAARARAVAAAVAPRARRVARADAGGSASAARCRSRRPSRSRSLLALAVTRPAGAAASRPPSRGRLLHRARLVVVDAGANARAARRAGSAPCAQARALARRRAARTSRWRRPPTAWSKARRPTCALIETALDRLAPGWRRRRGLAARRPAPTPSTSSPTAPSHAPLDADVVVHSVFEPAANVGDHRVRRAAVARRPAHAGEAYLEVANYAPAPQTVRVTLTRGDGDVFDRQRRHGGRRSASAGRAARARRRSARCARASARPTNALAIDDEAVAWIDARASRSTSRSSASATGWLRRAARSAIPACARRSSTRPTYRPGQRGRRRSSIAGRPPTPPARPALLIAPPPGTPWLGRASPARGRGTAPALGGRRQRIRSCAASIR